MDDFNTFVGDFSDEERNAFSNYCGYTIWKLKDGTFSAKHNTWKEQHRIYASRVNLLSNQMFSFRKISL